MKAFLLLLALCLGGSQAFAAIGVPNTKLDKFMDESPCYTAVGKMLSEEVGKRYYLNEVLCVLDGTAGEGTVHKKSGCALVYYNVEKGTIKGTSKDDFGKHSLVIAEKDCRKGGFKKLLEMETIKGSGIKVRDSLKSGKGTYIQPARLIHQYKGFEF